MVSGTVVSTGACVSGGGGGGGGTKTVEVDDGGIVDVDGGAVVVDDSGVSGSVVVVVGGVASPHQVRVSKSHKSGSAGIENDSINCPSGATTCTVATQHDPSIGNWPVVSSS